MSVLKKYIPKRPLTPASLAGIEDQLREALRGRVEEAWLFGSAATGRYDITSDIDLILIHAARREPADMAGPSRLPPPLPKGDRGGSIQYPDVSNEYTAPAKGAAPLPSPAMPEPAPPAAKGGHRGVTGSAANRTTQGHTAPPPFAARGKEFADLFAIYPELDILVYTRDEFEALLQNPGPGFWQAVRETRRKLL